MKDRIDVIGARIDVGRFDHAIEAVAKRAATDYGGYVCFVNAHVAVMARRDRTLLDVINQSFLSLPDGKSLHWLGKAKGMRNMDRVPGPDFFDEFLRRHDRLDHYFYGSTPEVLEQLIDNLRRTIPSLNVVGFHSPPFGPLDRTDYSSDVAAIRASGAQIVWVALGAPKQERWMSTHWKQLKPAMLLGVGAAFDFHAGSVKRAPVWLQNMGLEWGHRLIHEPARLWRRYFVTNALFIYYAIREGLK